MNSTAGLILGVVLTQMLLLVIRSWTNYRTVSPEFGEESLRCADLRIQVSPMQVTSIAPMVMMVGMLWTAFGFANGDNEDASVSWLLSSSLFYMIYAVNRCSDISKYVLAMVCFLCFVLLGLLIIVSCTDDVNSFSSMTIIGLCSTFVGSSCGISHRRWYSGWADSIDDNKSVRTFFGLRSIPEVLYSVDAAMPFLCNVITTIAWIVTRDPINAVRIYAGVYGLVVLLWILRVTQLRCCPVCKKTK
jgi:hypothetical protein